MISARMVSQIDLFAGLPEESQTEIARICKEIRPMEGERGSRAGDIAVRRAHPGPGLY